MILYAEPEVCEDDSAISFKYETAELLFKEDDLEIDFLPGLDEEECKTACLNNQECVMYEWIDSYIFKGSGDTPIRKKYVKQLIRSSLMSHTLRLRTFSFLRAVSKFPTPTECVLRCSVVLVPKYRPKSMCVEHCNVCRCWLYDDTAFPNRTQIRPFAEYFEPVLGTESPGTTVAGVKCYYPPEGMHFKLLFILEPVLCTTRYLLHRTTQLESMIGTTVFRVQ